MTYDQYRGNNAAHNGTAKAIRQVLANSPEPMSCDAIARATGLRAEKVKGAIAMLITVTGGIVSSKGQHGTVYTLYRTPAPVAKTSETRNVATSREPAEFKTLRRDPFLLMKLAEGIRR